MIKSLTPSPIDWINESKTSNQLWNFNYHFLLQSVYLFHWPVPSDVCYAAVTCAPALPTGVSILQCGEKTNFYCTIHIPGSLRSTITANLLFDRFVFLLANRTKECSADFMSDENCTYNRFGGTHFDLTQGCLHYPQVAALGMRRHPSISTLNCGSGK